jgi:hypothetical protein
MWMMNHKGSGRRRTPAPAPVSTSTDVSPDALRIVFRASRGRYAPTDA